MMMNNEQMNRRNCRSEWCGEMHPSNFLGQFPRSAVLEIGNPALQFVPAVNVENHQARRHTKQKMSPRFELIARFHAKRFSEEIHNWIVRMVSRCSEGEAVAARSEEAGIAIAGGLDAGKKLMARMDAAMMMAFGIVLMLRHRHTCSRSLMNSPTARRNRRTPSPATIPAKPGSGVACAK